MKQTFDHSQIEELYSKISVSPIRDSSFQNRQPIHVVYGGANLFKADTPVKLGRIAVRSMETYAANFAEFARAMWLKGADNLPIYDEPINELEARLIHDAERVKSENFAAWFAWTIYHRTSEKLRREPIEDFRIDFEDGYGFRPDAEEDAHAISASNELAKAHLEKTITTFCGFRTKSFQPETFRRAVSTLDLFLTNLWNDAATHCPKISLLLYRKLNGAKKSKF